LGKRVVITCWGSHGDLFPYIGLALALKRRGHAPVVATNAGFRPEVEREGIEFAVVGPPIDPNAPNARELFERVMDPIRGNEVIVRELLMPKLRQTYDELSAVVPGADILIGHPIAYATPLVAERLGLPWMATVLAPLSFFSAHDPAVMPNVPWLNDVPAVGGWLASTLLKLARPMLATWVTPVAELRAELGLPPGGLPMIEGQFSPFGTLALFSRVLARPQPDWPPNATITGCVFYNGPESALAPELEEFLAAGEPPVVFTLGTSAVGAAGRFYHESAAAAEQLKVRAVLLTGGFAQNRPERIPPGVLLVDRAPHQLLFPRASAVVHQVGAGTMHQALRAGRPTLAVPHGHDQFDNARRIRRLGIARTLLPRDYRAVRVATELNALLTEVDYRDRAALVAEAVRLERGADAAVDAIEQVLQRAR
jgi:UDP:flavonoid glycosyltransferase YjiC (YdhE family)